MEVRQLGDLRELSAEKLKKHAVFETGRFFLDVYCLAPGQAQKAHSHPGSDKVYVVLEGRCRVTVGEETTEVGPGSAVLAAAGAPHGIENTAPEPARLLVFMSPPPRP